MSKDFNKLVQESFSIELATVPERHEWQDNIMIVTGGLGQKENQFTPTSLIAKSNPEGIELIFKERGDFTNHMTSLRLSPFKLIELTKLFIKLIETPPTTEEIPL